jgi:manganese/iron transport system substrate-binding protein
MMKVRRHVKPRSVKPRSFWGATAVAIAISLVGCGPQIEGENDLADLSPADETAATEEMLSVVASYSVLCDLVEAVAVDRVDLNCLIDPAQDPHVYEGTPRDRQAIEQADLVFYGGLDFEPAIVAMIGATDTPAPKIALHEEAVPEPIMGHHDHGHSQDHDHDDYDHGHSHDHDHSHDHADDDLVPDPHVWHDVNNTIRMVEIIESNLAELDTENAEFYGSNAAVYIDKLEQLHAWIPEQIATIPENQRRLITTHDALGYYAEAYGLTVEGTLLGISTEEEPTAATVKSLSDSIKAEGVPTIFAELTADDRVLQTVANEANVTVSEKPLIADGLGDRGTPEGTYVGMMEYNTCVIVEGLGGQCSPFEPQT